jgi:hypothetical protein
MYLRPYWGRCLYRCDCCGAKFEGAHFLKREPRPHEYCRFCEAAWTRFIHALKKRMHMQ